MKKFKKWSAGLAIISLLITYATPFASAFDYPSPSDAAQQAMQGIMSNLGVNQSSVQSLVNQGNVLQQKGEPPTVSVSFTPSDLAPGQTVTATAIPTYFLNDPTQLYFTWYLKHDYCEDANGNIGSQKSTYEKEKDKCDLNDDNKVNIDDYKIEAARIMANAGFDWQHADYSKSNNHAGYKAVLGGNDRNGMNDYCYIHDFTSGYDYEIGCGHLFPNAPGDTTGDDHWSRNEEKFWRTDPNADDTSGSGIPDEATVAGLGKTSFSWTYQTGDQVGVAVEGVSIDATAYADSSYRIMWALPKNSCDVSLNTPEDTHNTSTATTYGSEAGGLGAALPNKIVTTTTTDVHYAEGSYTITKTDPTSDPSQKNADVGMSITQTTTTTTITQKYYKITGNLTGACTGATDTDHTSCDTNGDGYNDTAYYDNTSSPTVSTAGPTTIANKETINIKSADDLNQCLEDNLIDPAQGNSNQKLEVDLSYMPESPVNDLSDNGANSDTLIINSSILNAENKDFVNYDWQIALGDSIGTDNWQELTKSQLTDQAGVTQTSGLGLRNLSLKLNFQKSFLSDLGLPTTDTFYLKAILNATENADGGLKKKGIGTVIIPIHLSSTKIRVFATQVSDGLDMSLDQSRERCYTGMDSVVCPVAKDEIVGIKTDFDPNKYNLLWTLDGTPLPFTGKCTSDICDGGGNYSNENFFPVTAETGTKYTVTLEADDKDTGEKTTLTKIFQVADPTLSIASADETTCKPILLGNYVDLDNKLWPDYSTDSFEALQGSTVKLKPAFNTSINDYAWLIDSTPVTADNAAQLGVTLNSDGTISFPANKQLGDSYSIGISSLYTQPNDVKKALNKYWGVSLGDFYEKQVGTDINIKVTDVLTDASGNITGSVVRQKVLASIFSEIPSYVNFLFRVILTIALILFATGILFSFFPKQQEEN